jgi:hypothetical protein
MNVEVASHMYHEPKCSSVRSYLCKWMFLFIDLSQYSRIGLPFNHHIVGGVGVPPMFPKVVSLETRKQLNGHWDGLAEWQGGHKPGLSDDSYLT